MSKQQLILIELCVITNWLALLFFGLILYVFDVGDLSSFGLATALIINLPISFCYGLFIARFKPPIAHFLMTKVSFQKPVGIPVFVGEVSKNS